MAEVREVAYHADGRRMVGTLALPAGSGSRPAVLIAHEGPGLDDRQKARAATIADLGYVVFALDYHGGGQRIEDRPAMMARLNELSADPERLRAIGAAGLDVLLAEPRTDPARVAAIGYCYGGAVALELARMGRDLKCVVAFHPTLSTLRPQDAANISGKVLVCIGADDPMVGVDERRAFEEEMRAGRVDWSMIVFGGAEHAFTNADAGTDRPGIRYDAEADAKSWQAMIALFDQTLGRA